MIFRRGRKIFTILHDIWISDESNHFQTVRNFIDGAITETAENVSEIKNFRVNLTNHFGVDDLSRIFKLSFIEELLNMIDCIHYTETAFDEQETLMQTS